MKAGLTPLHHQLLGRLGKWTGFASDLLAAVIKENPGLSAEERLETRDTFYRIVAMRRRLAFALRNEAPPPLALWLANEVDTGRMSPDEARDQLRTVDWERVRDVDARVDAEEQNPVRRFGIRHSLPDWLAHRFLEELGDEADAFARAQNAPPPLTIRANLLRCTRDELAAELAAAGVSARKTLHASTGLVLESALNLFRLKAFKAGRFEQQDEASQLVAEVVAPPPKGRVLDLCAGAGGKALALAALLDNHGSVVATDIESDKLRDLKQRARRAGVHNVRPIRIDKDDWPEDVADFARAADRILCDVPCSGLGVLRRNTDQRWRIPQEQLEIIAGVQRKLARRAAGALQPGARMVYSTCSVLRSENEDVVEALLRDDPGLEPVRIAEVLGNARALPVSDPSGTYLKTWPHRHGMDGFFAAVVRRRR